MEQKELVKMVENLQGCKIAEIEYLADVKMTKAEQAEIGKVQKHVIGSFQLNYTYENAVNNRLEKQGGERTFQTGHLSWGTWMFFNKIIAHKGELYLRVYTYKGAKMQVKYLVDGKVATAEQTAKIKAILANKNDFSQKQANCGLVEHQVQAKTIKMSNIIALVCGEFWHKGENYKIEVA